MSKGILEFDLPEEEIEFRTAQRGADYWMCIEDIRQQIRNTLKWNDGLSDGERKQWQDMQDLLYTTLSARGVYFD